MAIPEKTQHTASRVLFVPVHFFPLTTGYGSAAAYFLRASEKHAPEISYTVLTTDTLNGNSEISLSNSTVIRLKTPQIMPVLLASLVREVMLFLKIISINRTEKFHAIFFETTERALCLWLLSFSSLRHITAVRIHGATETEFYWWSRTFHHRVRFLLARSSLRRIKHIFATTPYYIQFCKEKFFGGNLMMIGGKVFGVIPNVFVPKDSAATSSIATLKRLGLTNDSYFLTVGRMDSEGLLQKGFLDLVAAVFLAYQISPKEVSEFRFVLVGDGNERVRMEKIVNDSGLSDLCIFIPHLPNEEVQHLATHARAALFPSRFEGVSIFSLECLANGTPMLLSHIGGNADVVVDGYNGYAIPPQDIIALRDALLRMMRASSDEIRTFRKHSQEHFEKMFSPESVTPVWRAFHALIREDFYSN